MSDRPVWRPARPENEPLEVPERLLRCGGPDDRAMSVDERFEHFRALRREQAAAEARAAEEDEEARAQRRKPDDDEDEQRVIERFRNDRYAVKLLQQSDNVWGRGAGDTGALG
jgi:hypothetical protein